MRTLLDQATRFTIVGVAATLIHMFVTVLLVDFVGWRNATAATVIAFLCALVVSYFGQYRWTFRARENHGRYVWKFVFVAVGGLGLNAGMMYVGTSIFHLNYLIPLAAIVLSVPALTFVLNRYWTFRAGP